MTGCLPARHPAHDRLDEGREEDRIESVIERLEDQDGERRTLRHAGSLLAGAALALGACESAPETTTVSVRDSAGIQIVHSTAPAWGPDEAWTVAADPVVDIGVVEGDEAYQLNIVSDAAFTSEGGILVADALSANVRLFGPDGRHLRTFGGAGEGPGEFQVVARVWPLAGDSVLTFDAGLARLVLFAPDGSFVSTARLEHREELGLPQVDQAFGDGSLLALSGVGFSYGPADRGRIDGGQWILSKYDRDGRFVMELARLPGASRWAIEGAPQVFALPFALDLAPLATAGDRLYLGTGNEFAVEERTTGDAPQRLIRWDGVRTPVGDTEVARYEADALDAARNEERRAVVRRYLNEVPFPDAMPAYQKLLVDDAGYIWVERYRPPWDDLPRWTVFDPDGSWLGEVELPPDVRVFRIGSRGILGLRRDELDVQHVVVLGFENR